VFVPDQGLDARPMAPSTRRLGRCLGGAAVAAGVTALVTWWLNEHEASEWWLVPAIVAPALGAAWWAARDQRASYRWVAAAVAVSACYLVAWLVWVPEPLVFRVVRDHEAAATRTAMRVIATTRPGTCRAPTPADVGVLARAGPWSQVCVFAPTTNAYAVYVLRRADGSAGVTYTTVAAHDDQSDPDSCYRHIVGGWVAHIDANLEDPADPCPYRYQFEGGP